MLYFETNRHLIFEEAYFDLDISVDGYCIDFLYLVHGIAIF